MELKDTIALMESEDYKDRFKAEYQQLKIRTTKLRNMIVRHEAKTLDFEPTCPMHVLHEQLNHMERYLWLLEVRAETEKIEL